MSYASAHGSEWLGEEMMGLWCWLQHTSSFGSRPAKRPTRSVEILVSVLHQDTTKHWLVDVAQRFAEMPENNL